MIGTTLGHFKVVAKLAESRSGALYRAEDEALRRPVVLKILSPALASDPEHKARFLKAACAASLITHPHVAAVHEVGETEGRVWVAMELVEGPSLRSRLAGRPLPLLETLKVGEQVAEGLAAAHERNLAHGDLRPEKVVLGPGGQVKLVDLGLGEERPGESYDTRTDVYRLGVMLYEMATGWPPAARDPEAATAAAVVPPSTLNPETPAELDRIIGACLEPDPEDRYQHSGQLAIDLGKLRRRTETAPVVVPSGGALAERTTPLRTRRILMMSAAGVVLVTVLGLAGWKWIGPHEKPGPPFKKGDRILVADFINETSDVELGVALREVFELFFYDSVGLPTVYRDTTTETAALDGAAAEARCLKGECEGYATGKLAGDGGGYRLEIALYRAGRAKPIFARSTRTDDKRVGQALHDTMEEIDRTLQDQGGVGKDPGFKPCWIFAGDARSVKAGQALVRGEWKFIGGHNAEAIALLNRARELDPTIPDIYAYLGFATMGVGRRREGVEHLKEAWQRWSAAVDAQPECRGAQLLSEIMYLERTWGYDAEMERLNRAVQLFPDDINILLYMSFASHRAMDDPAAALPFFREIDSLWITTDFTWLPYYLMASGKVDEVDPLIAEFRRRGGFPADVIEANIAHIQVAQAYARGEDYLRIFEMINRLVAEGRLPEGEARGLRAWSLSSAGRLSEAENWEREAEKGDTIETTMAFGRSAGGDYGLLDWLEKRRTGKVRALESAEADKYLDSTMSIVRLAQSSVDLGTPHPLAEALQTVADEQRDNHNRHVLDAIQYGRGCLALIEGRGADAVDLLEPLAREYGPHSLIPPQHVLGRAYEAVGRLRDAAQAYEAVLEKRQSFFGKDNKGGYWMVPEIFGPVFVLEQHRLAGIYERLGNAERARYWYDRFLNDWRNADPGIPEVEDAKRRLAGLEHR